MIMDDVRIEIDDFLNATDQQILLMRVKSQGTMAEPCWISFVRISGLYDEKKMPSSQRLHDAGLQLSRISAMKLIKPNRTGERND
jgi:hypothetical protein